MTWNTAAQRRQIEDLRARGRRGAARGMDDALDAVLAESNKHVPRESDDLAKSGGTSLDEEALKGQVSYSSYYAPFQHESLTDEHEAGQTAKFLENAFNSLRPVLPRIVARSIDREVGR